MKEQENQLATQSADAQVAIAMWEERCIDLGKQLDSSEQDRKMYSDLQKEIKELRAQNSSLELEIHTSHQNLQSFETMVHQLNDEKNSLSDQLNNLQQHHLNNDQLQKTFDELKVENMELKVIIGQLEDELRDANDALRSHITDDISIRATELATEALKTQLSDLRKQITIDRNTLRTEMESRVLAEQEVEKLREDLLILAQGLDEGNDLDSKLKKLRSRAAESIVRRDLDEINSMRLNLRKITEELSACRVNERNAEDRATHYQSQMSLLQQELSVARNEALSTMQILEVERESEAKNRLLLENRIQSLTMDADRVTSSLRQEVNSLRLSLSRALSDRERLVVLLQQSESANKSLVHAAIESGGSHGPSEDSELEALRVERIHYLSKISQDACDAERRVREAVAINTAELQAQVYIERGLRSTAERLVEDLQKQVVILKSDRFSVSSSSSALAATCDNNNCDREVYSLRLQLSDTTTELQNVKSENADLQQRLYSMESESSLKIKELLIKCHETERALTEVQRKEEYEASISKEMTLLKKESLYTPFRLSTSSPPRDSHSTENCQNDENTDPNSMDVGVLVNQISEMKRSIESERLYYEEVKAEHDELLALLARQSVENECLQSTIVELAGKDELQKAMIAAEEEVVRKFGVL